MDFTGNVSTTVPVTVPVTNPGRFVQWLNYVGALANSNPAAGGGLVPPANPTVTLTAARHDVDKVTNQSVDWIDGTDPSPKTGSPSQMLLHFTFDMPIPTADAGTPTQCGHGIYSDFHVVSSSQSNGKTFPDECDHLAINSQERILEYMIWDLASCVPGPPTSTCTPKTCAAYPAGTCGQQTDGCNGLTANCGTCATALTCGGGGTPAVCGAPDGGACKPLTCAAYASGTCGQQSDGCGGVTPDCNPCPAGQTCGGGGRERPVRLASRQLVHPEDLRAAGHRMRPGRRRLREHPPELRLLSGAAVLRRWRRSWSMRGDEHVRAADMREAEHRVRSRR